MGCNTINVPIDYDGVRETSRDKVAMKVTKVSCLEMDEAGKAWVGVEQIVVWSGCFLKAWRLFFVDKDIFLSNGRYHHNDGILWSFQVIKILLPRLVVLEIDLENHQGQI